MNLCGVKQKAINHRNNLYLHLKDALLLIVLVKFFII